MAKIVKGPQPFFYILFGLLAFISLYIVRAYLGLFFLALVITIVFDPLYRFLETRVKRPPVASILTTLLLIVLILIPVILLSSIAISQSFTIINNLQKTSYYSSPVTQYITDSANQIAQVLTHQYTSLLTQNQGNLTNLLEGGATMLSNILFKNILPVISFSIQAIAQTVFFFVFLVYLFPYRQKMFKALSDITPVSATEHQLFIKRFEAVTVGTITSMIVIGAVQGFLGGLMLAFLGFPAAAFWGLLMAFASLIPFGTGVIWIPISLYLVFSGQWWQGIVLFAWGTLVISTVDNIIRAKLLSRGDAKLPEILTLISVLGGINTFGFWGFIYGPALVGLFYTALIIYRERRLKTNHVK
jgi:predicted PurR-regulated permease PerM